MGAPPPKHRGLLRSRRKQWCQMANVDFVGDTSGGITHYWPGRLSDRIEGEAKLSPALSGKELPFPLDFLGDQAAEVRAALIAYELYDGYEPEFWTRAYKIAGINARFIASVWDPTVLTGDGKDHSKKWLVGYTGATENVVGRLQELAWLRHAIGAGATPADLVSWGVDKFTVIQLQWWERRENETRLSQHIRAIRNGWGLRYLEAAVRDVYRNLLQTVDAQQPTEFIAEWETELAEVRELQTFFSPDTALLSDKDQKEWAKAFFAAGIEKIAPDAWGQFAHFLPASFKEGVLRKPLEPIARYLQSTGVGPGDWANFDASWFGR